MAADDLAGGRLTIDLGALVANWRFLGGLAPGAESAAVVKGDGYGIGIDAATRALADAGCRTFFVALPAEGLRVRALVPTAAVYVLNGLFPGAAADYGAADLRPCLSSWPEIEEWAAFRNAGGKTGAAIHVDTGMNRLGLGLREALDLARRKELLASLGPTLLVSHLACADMAAHSANPRQLALFRQIIGEFPGLKASLASSAGIFLGPAYHFDMTRPGVALYGTGAPPGHEGSIRTVVTAEARVLAIREAEAGETIGYGAGHRLKRPSRIAVLGAGYADGYHRAAGASDAKSGAEVWLRGQRAPILGRVSMDLIAVDVTEIPAAARGDFAELFGPNVPVDEVARHAGTIGYELLTGLGRRYARRYVGEA
jgi:alanine racemase